MDHALLDLADRFNSGGFFVSETDQLPDGGVIRKKPVIC